MKRGDFVRLTYNAQTVRAMVLLVSNNERSVMLGFDGGLRAPVPSLGVFAGAMPLLRDDDGTWRDLIAQAPATIEPEQ